MVGGSVMARVTPSSSESEAPEPLRRSSARGALTVMGGTLASRTTGLLREVLLVALFPVWASDAFRLAWTVPNLFRELLAEGALTNAFIPIYQRLQGGDRRAFAGAMLSVLALANGVLLALALAGAPWIVDLLLARDANVDRELAVQMVRLTFPVLFAISLSALAMGVLNAEERFFAPAWAPVLLNLTAIAAMLAFPGEAQWLALGVVLGGALQALVQWPAMWRAGVLPALGRSWHAAVPLALALMAPFAFTTGARQILNVVAQRIVSNEALFPAGAVTAYALSTMLFSLVLGLFAISPAMAYYARLGNLAAEGAPDFGATLEAGTRFILLLTLPAGAATFVFAEPAVRTVFGLLRPAAGQDVAIALAALALAPLGIALPGAGLVNFLLRPFFVRQRVIAPVALSAGFTLLTALSFVLLAPRLGIAGISWGTALAMTLQALVLLLWLRRAEGLDLRAVLRQVLRVGGAAAAAVAAARWAAQGLVEPVEFAPWLASAALVALGGTVTLLVFAGLAYLLCVPELRRCRRPRGGTGER
jgi:putative peptidoglycan lipid II flippase